MGSPNKRGSTAILVDHFKRGAEENGHEVDVIDVCHADVNPCIGCVRCGYEGPCVQQDDTRTIRAALLSADMVVFATPLYYYGMTAQLKAVIDRFYAINGSIHVPKKAVLLMTYANTAASEAVPLKSHYEVLLKYLGWTDAGLVIAPGVWPVGAIRHTRFPEQAYRLGKSI